MPDRRSSSGENRTRFELNVGVPPRPGLVPFGCPGWAFVPESLRRKRGRPKYERAEPVLCVGYQHMYTRVYKCLTRHGSVIHSEQVNWDMEAPLGLFPTLDGVASHTEPVLNRLDVDVFKPAGKPVAAGKVPPAASRKGLPAGTIRINRDKVYARDGTPKPKPYIYDRIRSVDGLSVEEAQARVFPDKNGNPKRYSGDIAYDLYHSQWIRIESGSDSALGAKEANSLVVSESHAAASCSHPASVAGGHTPTFDAHVCSLVAADARHASPSIVAEAAPPHHSLGHPATPHGRPATPCTHVVAGQRTASAPAKCCHPAAPSNEDDVGVAGGHAGSADAGEHSPRLFRPIIRNVRSRAHPEGMLGICMTRARKRYALRLVARQARRHRRECMR